MFYRFIVPKSSGWIETLDGNARLGKKPSEVVEFLKDPVNEEILTNLLNKIEPYWTI